MSNIARPPPTDKKPTSKRVAFLVIHGISQQRPYKTLDQFGPTNYSELRGELAEHLAE